ncbi:MAG: isoleucine--tRNA ligase [Christensenellales bacterium]
MYKPVSTSMDFVEREKEVSDFWKEEDIFRESIRIREGCPVFSFYDGPPTANGQPHVGHVLTRAIKDLIPRYRTMKGYKVLRKAGWDTHGLPVELEVEKELGLSGKPQIEAYGVAAFNEKCKESVWKYKSEWERLSERVGFWADMDNPYITYDNDYIESGWWALKTIADKGLLYKGYKVVPYCPRCGTALASHEVAQGYKQVKERSAIVRFKLRGEEASILVWTTTPWTLPSNVALCVNADEEYVRAALGEETYILAGELVSSVLGEQAEVLERFPGSALVGKEYEPLWDFGDVNGKAWFVVADDYVTLTDGTGVVHIAPGFGADDARIGMANGLPLVQKVDNQGNLCGGTPWDGLFCKDADPLILKNLESSGRLFSAPDYEHDYPFCWRCDTPLIYYARSGWFIRMTQVKEALQASNRSVNWIPETIKEGRMGNFIDNVVDWAISRERYWGTPLPVWVCDCGHTHVVGSRKELEELGHGVTPGMDLHRPYIDRVTLTCPDCGKEMHRIPEVADCWFDSGSMPYAQWHYPFENKEMFEENFPADFISEAIDQTRGWFYTLLALSTLLFGKASFKNCLVLGHVGDKDGVKMSKHKGNVVDPWSVLDTRGADAVRWYFFVGSAPWLPSRFSNDAVKEAQQKFMGTLWNTYAFYILYANIDEFDPTKHTLRKELGVMDRWLLSRLESLVQAVDGHLENYRITEAGRAMADFVDELSNWYVRRGRERYWASGMGQDKLDAYMTLYTALERLARLAAPFVPFMTETMYRNLVCSVDPEAPKSVHLCDYPVADVSRIDRELEENMERVLEIVTLARSARNTAALKNRQPCAALYIQGQPLPEDYAALVRDELNVKELLFVEDTSDLVDYSLKPQLRTLGPRLGRRLNEVRGWLVDCDGCAFMRTLRETGSVTLPLEGGPIVLTEEDVLVSTLEKEGLVSACDRGVTVLLDTNLTPALIREGRVREIISKVQNMRRNPAMGTVVTDRIALRWEGDERLLCLVEENRKEIYAELLAVEAPLTEEPSVTETFSVDGMQLTVSAAKA